MLGVITIVFILLHVSGDPASLLVTQDATRQDMERIRQAYGLDRPLSVQYARFMVRIARGDLGYSYRQGMPVTELIAERLEDGPWRVAVSMMLGHMAMRLADPRGAARHYDVALARAPTHGTAAMSAQGNMAIALASLGRYEDARTHAHRGIAIAKELGAGWRHADAFDVLRTVGDQQMTGTGVVFDGAVAFNVSATDNEPRQAIGVVGLFVPEGNGFIGVWAKKGNNRMGAERWVRK